MSDGGDPASERARQSLAIEGIAQATQMEGRVSHCLPMSGYLRVGEWVQCQRAGEPRNRLMMRIGRNVRSSDPCSWPLRLPVEW